MTRVAGGRAHGAGDAAATTSAGDSGRVISKDPRSSSTRTTHTAADLAKRRRPKRRAAPRRRPAVQRGRSHGRSADCRPRQAALDGSNSSRPSCSSAIRRTISPSRSYSLRQSAHANRWPSTASSSSSTREPLKYSASRSTTCASSLFTFGSGLMRLSVCCGVPARGCLYRDGDESVAVGVGRVGAAPTTSPYRSFLMVPSSHLGRTSGGGNAPVIIVSGGTRRGSGLLRRAFRDGGVPRPSVRIGRQR